MCRMSGGDIELARTILQSLSSDTVNPVLQCRRLGDYCAQSLGRILQKDGKLISPLLGNGHREVTRVPRISKSMPRFTGGRGASKKPCG